MDGWECFAFADGGCDALRVDGCLYPGCAFYKPAVERRSEIEKEMQALTESGMPRGEAVGLLAAGEREFLERCGNEAEAG